MLPEYDKEVDDFLQNVNNLTEDDIMARVDSETSEEDVDGKVVLDEITEVVGTVVDAATAVKKPSNRYRWKVQEVVGEYLDTKEKKKKYCNIFLDDKNTHDLIFSELLISEQPYRAAKKGQALDDFIIKCKNSVNSNGNKPLSRITAGSYRTRTAAYRSLAAYWSDKTGPVLLDGKELGDEWRNKSYKDMSVSGKIAYNVDNYIEDYKALDKIESKNKEVAEIAQGKEKQDKYVQNGTFNTKFDPV